MSHPFAAAVDDRCNLWSNAVQRQEPVQSRNRHAGEQLSVGLGCGGVAAMTTSMTVHFLTRPRPEDVRAEGRLLKLGRRLAVGEVVMRSAADPEPVCHVTGTYALPPKRG